MKVEEQGGKYKTTLYLTEENRRRLKQIPKRSMTRLINEAIAEKLTQIEKAQAKQRLLDSLEKGVRTPARERDVVEIARKLRQKAAEDAVDF